MTHQVLLHLTLTMNLRNDLGALSMRMHLRWVDLPKATQIIRDRTKFTCLLVRSVFFMTPIFKEGEIKSEMSSRSEAGAFPSLLMDPAVRQVLLEPPARYLREPHEQLYEARTITVPILRMRKKRVRKLATGSKVTRIRSVHGAKSVQAWPS